MIQNVALQLVRGDNAALRLTVTDAGDAAFDLAGYSAELRIGADEYAGTIAGGVISFALTTTQTQALTGSRTAEVVVTKSGVELTLVTGFVRCVEKSSAAVYPQGNTTAEILDRDKVRWKLKLEPLHGFAFASAPSAAVVTVAGEGVPSGGTTGQYLRKTSSSAFATEWDTLGIDDVSGLQSALDGKSAVGHTHTASQITDGNTQWRISGATGANSDVSGASATLTRFGNRTVTLAVTGTSNAMFGYRAGEAVTSGAEGTYIGSNSGTFISTGSRNVSVGAFSLNSPSAGNVGNCTAIGYAALGNYSGTGNCVAVGSNCMPNLTSGVSDVAVGTLAGQNLSTGSNNTFVGHQAGRQNTSASLNTALGSLALNTNVTGASITAIGANALQSCTAGPNTAVGASAGVSTSTGTGNCFIGSSSGRDNSTGNSNIAIGGSALQNSQTGNHNIAMGSSALSNCNGGSSNIGIGSGCSLASATDSNQLVIGSAANYVATNGGATTYFGTSGSSLGFIQVRLNGSNVKLQVYAP